MQKLLDQIAQDFWKHVGGLLAASFGFVGWYQGGLSHDPTTIQLAFMVAGLATTGVLIANGTAAAAAAATKQAIYDAATLAAKEVMATAAAQAVAVREVAVTTAEKLPAVVAVAPPTVLPIV
jgi:nucleoid-associated protein YgaU